VVVGGMLTAAFLILVVLPVLYEMVHRRTDQDE
jgi:heavy metal efflux system protein